jgi:hypothetical protein
MKETLSRTSKLKSFSFWQINSTSSSSIVQVTDLEKIIEYLKEREIIKKEAPFCNKVKLVT